MIFYFYLLNDFLGYNSYFFSHAAFLLFWALYFQVQVWILMQFNRDSILWNSKGSLCICLLSVAYFHWVVYCGLICQLPPWTQYAETLHNPVLCDFLGAIPVLLGTQMRWIVVGRSLPCQPPHQSLCFFHEVEGTELLSLFLHYCLPHCIDQMGLTWGANPRSTCLTPAS